MVTYLEYAAVAHAQIRWVSFGDTLSWMGRISEGETPETDCGVKFEAKPTSTVPVWELPQHVD